MKSPLVRGPPRAGPVKYKQNKETELEARKFRLVNTTFTSLKPYDSPYYHPTPNFSSESRETPGVVWTRLSALRAAATALRIHAAPCEDGLLTVSQAAVLARCWRCPVLVAAYEGVATP